MSEASRTRAELLDALRVLEVAHRQAQATIQERDQLYRLMFENSLGLMCSHDLDGVLLAINPAAARSLGYQPEDGIGRNLREFIAPALRHLFDAYLVRIREHSSDSGLLRLVARDGSERVWTYRNVLYEEPGSVPRVLGHAQDITERIAAEQALKESKEELERARNELAARVAARTAELKRGNERLRASEARFRALSEQAGDLIAILGPEAHYRYASPSHRRILGHVPEDLVGRDTFELVHPEDCPAARAAWTAGLARRGAFAPPPLELRLRHAGGEWRVFEITGNNRLHDPAVRGVIVTARDVTRRRQAEEERTALLSKEQEARSQAEAAARARDAVLTAAAHDLRTPLTVINGHVTIMGMSLESGRDLSADWLRRHTTAIGQAAARMQATVEEITDAAQLRAGQTLALRLETVEVGEMIRAVVAALGAGAGRRLAPVVVGEIAALTVQGDRVRLERVLHNIVGNAVKYSPAGTPVQVEVRARDGWAVVTVRDSGVGIPAAELPLVFTQFYRASTAAGFPGMGIGLAGARAIVEQHGGRIEIDSEVGRGTTVVVSLPPHPPGPGVGRPGAIQSG